MRFYVQLQSFDVAMARVGEADSKEEAVQIALTFFAHDVATHDLAEPVVSVYERGNSDVQVFWIGRVTEG